MTRAAFQQWLEHPEKSRVRNAFFQAHLWIGAIAGMYIFVMSLSGSLIASRTRWPDMVALDWLADLHANLLMGATGRRLNGIGAMALTVLCLTGAVIWWPGVQHWRRGLIVDWRARFPRITWDLHSALGFWCFGFVAVWAISGMCFSLPLEAWFGVDPGGAVLTTLADLHIGRFGWLAEAVWTLVGLVPAILAFTGVFICCRRVMFRKPSNPRNYVD